MAPLINRRQMYLRSTLLSFAIVVLFAFFTTTAFAVDAPPLVLEPWEWEMIPEGLNDPMAWQEFINRKVRGLGKELPPEFEDVARTFKEEAERFVLPDGRRMNWPALLVQSLHETGFYQYGRRARAAEFNVAGLGITEDDETTTRQDFGDLRTGVRAFLEHMSVYATGRMLDVPTADRTKLVQKDVSEKVTSFLKKIRDKNWNRGGINIRDLGSLPNPSAENFREVAVKFGGSVEEFNRKYGEYARKYGPGGAVAYSGDPLYGGKLMDHYLEITPEVMRIHEELKSIYGGLAEARPRPATPSRASAPSRPRSPAVDYGDLASARKQPQVSVPDYGDLAGARPPAGSRPPATDSRGTTGVNTDLTGLDMDELRSRLISKRISLEDYLRERERRGIASGSITSDRHEPEPPNTRPSTAQPKPVASIKNGAYLLNYVGQKTTPSPWLLYWKGETPDRGMVSFVARKNLPDDQAQILKKLGLMEISGLVAERDDRRFAIQDAGLRKAADGAARAMSDLGEIGNALAMSWGVVPAGSPDVKASFRVFQAEATLEPTETGSINVSLSLRLTTTISSASGPINKTESVTSRFIAVPVADGPGTAPTRSPGQRTEVRRP